MPPIALTDSQMMAILAAAAPLAAHDRNPFLMEVAELLQALPEVGDGALHRVIMQVQRRHFDPGRGKGYPLSALQSAPQSSLCSQPCWRERWCFCLGQRSRKQLTVRISYCLCLKPREVFP